jgi:pseudouridine-5'-phosphate glycosidase
MLYSRFLEISSPIQRALKYNQPVVAIESGVFAHSFDFPANVELAITIEKIIKKVGALPALIGIVNGRIVIGLTADEMRHLVKNASNKISRQDIPSVIALSRSGVTTAGATMVIAQFAGIKVAISGAVGAVTTNLVRTISADLDEFERSDVALICSGAKVESNMSLTLEYLETRGIPVIGYKTKEFPCFYSRTSGYAIDYSVDTPLDAAAVIKTKWDLGLRGGVLIANPIPENAEIEWELLSTYIERAKSEADGLKLFGKKLTPFLLEKISEYSEGKSKESIAELLKSNAEVAASIATKLSTLYH